jgi:CelD/BcsL family acetyltransferase involved in cellulose biosynthesis
MSKQVIVARTDGEVRALRHDWDSIGVEHPHADLDFYLSVIDTRPEVERPHSIIAYDDGQPVGLIAARLEEIRLDTSFGYRNVYRPRVRALTSVPGGCVIRSEAAVAPLVTSVHQSLRSGEADVAVFPSLRRDSHLFEALAHDTGRLRQQHFVEVRTHRRLHLPSTYDEFLSSRTRKVRSGIRYDAKKLEGKMGSELRVERLASTDELDRIFTDIVRVAGQTYQSGLGASFADTPERRTLTQLSLDRGWFRAWVLYRDATPIAFWQGSLYRNVYHSGSTGYDPAYGRDRVGIYLLMRVIDHLCEDPGVDVFDFGFGDAEYKRHFADESWSESDVLIFAPTIRAIRINVGRTSILGAATGARRVLAALGLADRLKTAWRRRLRSARP